jgi:uncharacterized protein (TIGR03435 family)
MPRVLLFATLIASFPFKLGFAQSPPAFEVATVKPAADGSHAIGMFTYPGGRVVISEETLENILCEVYGFEPYQISGGPDWVRSQRWNIEAKAAENSGAAKFVPVSFKSRPNEEMLAMLKTLLAERFQLKIHNGTKEGPAYALTIAPKGHKLEVTAHADQFGAAVAGRSGKPDRPRFLGGENASMPMFAKRLSGILRKPVLDETRLTGFYDFRFEYADENNDPAAGGPSLFTAIEEQIGLKLVSTRAPEQVFIIDHAEKPSSN